MTRTVSTKDRGASLILVISLVAILAFISAALIQYAGSDRVRSAQRAQEARGLTCADAGIQVARRIVGCAYKDTNNWNDYLAWNDGFDAPGNFTVIAGTIDGVGEVVGAPPDPDDTDFVVTVVDDEDEAPDGQPNNAARDNNLTILLRSRCINPFLAAKMGEQEMGAVTEVRMVYIPGLSDHGSAPSGSNAMEAAAGGDWVRTNVSDCPEP
jgi:hypothetical protein